MSEEERELLQNAKTVSGAWDSLWESVGKAMEEITKQEYGIVEDVLEEARGDGLGRVIVVQKAIVKHKNGDISFQSTIRIGKTDVTKSITLTYLPPETREEK